MDQHCSVVVEDTTKEKDRWLNQRRLLGIGASESAEVLGIRGSAMDLYAQKIGALDYEDGPDTEGMEIGREVQPIVLGIYARKANRQVLASNKLLQSVRWPFMICTPDAHQCKLTTTGLPTGADGLVEAKFTSYGYRWHEEGVPRHVYCQAQHQLAVTGLTWTTVAGLFYGPEIVWKDYERDDTFINDVLLPGCEAFWKCVLERTPPSPDAHEKTRKALEAIYPNDLGTTIQLGGEFIDIHEQLEQWKHIEKGAIEDKRLLENKLRAAMGDHTYAALPNGIIYSLKRQTRFQKPLAAEDCKTSSFRRLRVCKRPKEEVLTHGGPPDENHQGV